MPILMHKSKIIKRISHSPICTYSRSEPSSSFFKLLLWITGLSLLISNIPQIRHSLWIPLLRCFFINFIGFGNVLLNAVTKFIASAQVIKSSRVAFLRSFPIPLSCTFVLILIIKQEANTIHRLFPVRNILVELICFLFINNYPKFTIFVHLGNTYSSIIATLLDSVCVIIWTFAYFILLDCYIELHLFLWSMQFYTKHEVFGNLQHFYNTVLHNQDLQGSRPAHSHICSLNT